MEPRISATWVALVALALIARIGAAIAIGSGFHFADEAIYFDTARRLASGDGFGVGYQQAPGYPVFLLLLWLWRPQNLLFLRIGQAVITAGGTFLVFRLADRLFGRQTALVSALVYALDPLTVIAAGLLYPEATTALLIPAVVLAVWNSTERGSVPLAALAGGLLGVAALFRPVALILAPVLAAWICFTRSLRPARRVLLTGTLGLTFLLVLTPWTARNYRVHGKLMPVALAGTQMAPAPRKDVRRHGLVVSMTRRAWHDPAALVSRTIRQFIQFWEPAPTRLTTDIPSKRESIHLQDPRVGVDPLFPRNLRDTVSAASFILELILATVGLGVVARARRRETFLILSVILAWAFGYALFVAKLRYRIPILPLLFLFTGSGASAVLGLIRGATARQHDLRSS